MDKKVIHYLFEDIAGKSPSRIAIETADRHITYEALNALSNRIAGLLQSIGCKSGQIVNVVAPSSIELVASMIAVFKSGGIYLPMDIAFSEKRLRQIFDGTFEGVTIVSAQWLEFLLEITATLEVDIPHLVVIQPDDQLLMYHCNKGALQPLPVAETASWRNDPGIVVNGHDTNYIFYTSGSTGDAKAIAGAHVSLSHFIHWEIGEFAVTADARISQLTQATFDASLRDIFVALSTGATLCIPAASVKNDPAGLLRWLESSRITLMHCVPSLFRVLTKEWLQTPDTRYDLGNLQYILMAGELLFAKDILHWRSVAGDQTTLINLYGPTETTMVKTFYRIGDVGNNPAQPLPVGVPISNTIVAIVKDGRLCQPGETGEIYIKTPFATKGYYRNEALTAQYFVQNPLQQQTKDIVYKTGDLGRWLPDGIIEVLGRIDSQVKINGIRVELLEVEKAIRAVENITGVVVTDYRTEDNLTALIAYYTGKQTAVEDFRDALQKLLNPQLIPSWFIWLPEFPLNLNGKIDKKALPSPAATMMGEASYQAPEGEIEEALAACWQEVLGLENIGRNVSFFSIGGHSLRVVQLVSRIYKAFGVHLKVADIFTKPTLAAQAALISTGLGKTYQQIPPAPEAEHYPLSSAQRRLWMLSQFEVSSVAYNMSGVYVFEGALNIPALELAFQDLVNRHESLRTVFRETAQGEVRQFILSPASIPAVIQHHDLRENADADERLKAALQANSGTAFDLTHGLLLRALLFRMSEQKWVFAYYIHHIVCDDWSMDILINELLKRYKVHAAGAPDNLLALQLQYKDFTVWQQSHLFGDTLNASRQYWLTQLGGELPVLDLRLDHPRPAVQTFNGGKISTTLKTSVYKGLEQLCATHSSTLFMGLLAAVNALLHKYTGSEDILIGTPEAGREHLDLEDQVGFYVNTLVLRTRFSGRESFTTLLDHVKEVILGAFEHQSYPFDTLVDELHIKHDDSRNVLYDVGVTLQNTATRKTLQTANIDDVRISHYEGLERKISRSDLLFVFVNIEGQLGMAVEYNRDLFDQSTAQRILQHLEQLLEAIVASPEAAVGGLEYINTAEKQQLLVAFNDSATAVEEQLTLCKLFEDQATKFPENTAVVYGGTKLSYRELEEQANRLANYLQENIPAGKDQLVGIMLDRSANMIIAILAVLKAGRAYVPIDPELPPDRKSYIFQDTGIKMLITQMDYLMALDYYTGDMFAIDVQLDILDNLATPPAAAPQPQDLAYVIYTSGSTGKPKGVMVEHKGIVNTIIAQRDELVIKEHMNGLQFASFSFDASVSETFIILAAGATLHIIPEGDKKNISLLEKYIRDHHIDIATLPPACLRLMDVNAINSLGCLITAGEAAIRSKADEFAQTGTYYNAYGPTETSICATMYRHRPGILAEGNPVPIGQPIANTVVYIFDQYRLPVPIGVAGEIFVGGRGLARGYWNNPALTAERFVPDPFHADARLYRTGDLGRWLPSGQMEFIGRADNQVKVNGYRIELGEIEEILSGIHFIKEATVVVLKDKDDNNNLVAYYVASTTAIANISEEIRRVLAAHLPAYMVPGYFVALDHLPLNTSGKVDRKLLPDPVELSADTKVAYVAPRNDTERQLAEIWEEVLGWQQVSVIDDFFQLGGSSLKAMVMIKKMMDKTGFMLSMKSIFTERTIAGIAAAMQIAQQHGNTETDDDVEDTVNPQLTPASYNQLLCFSEWNTGNDTVVECYEIPDLQLPALKWAADQLIRRHEILRTAFVHISGKIYQRIIPAEETDFTITMHEGVLSEDAWTQVAAAEGRRVIDLAAPPYLFINVYQLEKGVYGVMFTIHHILTDGHSSGILNRELHQLYAAYPAQVHTLPALDHQYRHYSAWQHTFLQSPEGKEHHDYWHHKLNGFQSTIPALAPETRELRRIKGAIGIRTVISDDFFQDMDRFIKAQGLTYPALLITALNIFLYEMNEAKDITLTATISGRNNAHYGQLRADNLVGFFANALFIRNSIAENTSLQTYLREVRLRFLDDLNHDAYPTLKLVQELPGITPDLWHVTGFLNYHNYSYLSNAAYEADMFEKEGKIEQIPMMERAFGLTIMEHANCLRVQLKYNWDVFQDAAPDVILSRFFAVLRQIIYHPDTMISQIKMKQTSATGILDK
ncbi:amino acid adenylation domain-containing protein [Chitinophaga sp. Hz27]|uniref:amino acid adenylation domain-containing protein n=1 Tax=Chitinophaga sp. Hz27 TaxID=3347169 RepID=UPI0035DE4511